MSLQKQSRPPQDALSSHGFSPRPFLDESEQERGAAQGSIQANNAIRPGHSFGAMSVLPQPEAVQMAAAGSPTSAPAKRPTLHPGDRGPRVYAFQFWLNDKNAQDGCDPTHVPQLDVDGVYGKRTTAAIFTFQHRTGLPISGLADHPTRMAVGDDSDSAPTYGGGV